MKPFPAKLEIVAGDPLHVYWRCGRLDDGGGSQSPPTKCEGGELGVRVVFPGCLDIGVKGKPRLDSPDHRSHIAYSRPVAYGWGRCPRSHPMPVPALTMNAIFPISTTPGEVRSPRETHPVCTPTTSTPGTKRRWAPWWFVA